MSAEKSGAIDPDIAVVPELAAGSYPASAMPHQLLCAVPLQSAAPTAPPNNPGHVTGFGMPQQQPYSQPGHSTMMDGDLEIIARAGVMVRCAHAKAS